MSDRVPLGTNRRIVISQTDNGWKYTIEVDPIEEGRSYHLPTRDSAKSFDDLLSIIKDSIRTDWP